MYVTQFILSDQFSLYGTESQDLYANAARHKTAVICITLLSFYVTMQTRHLERKPVHLSYIDAEDSDS